LLEKEVAQQSLQAQVNTLSAQLQLLTNGRNIGITNTTSTSIILNTPPKIQNSVSGENNNISIIDASNNQPANDAVIASTTTSHNVHSSSLLALDEMVDYSNKVGQDLLTHAYDNMQHAHSTTNRILPTNNTGTVFNIPSTYSTPISTVPSNNINNPNMGLGESAMMELKGKEDSLLMTAKAMGCTGASPTDLLFLYPYAHMNNNTNTKANTTATPIPQYNYTSPSSSINTTHAIEKAADSASKTFDLYLSQFNSTSTSNNNRVVEDKETLKENEIDENLLDVGQVVGELGTLSDSYEAMIDRLSSQFTSTMLHSPTHTTRGSNHNNTSNLHQTPTSSNHTSRTPVSNFTANIINHHTTTTPTTASNNKNATNVVVNHTSKGMKNRPSNSSTSAGKKVEAFFSTKEILSYDRDPRVYDASYGSF
jgi:hypothetical protein